MTQQQQQQQLSAQPSAAATLESSLTWQGGSRQMAADSFMTSGQPHLQQQQQQQQQPAGMPGYATTDASALVPAAGAGAAGCGHITQTCSDELGSDEADFAMYGLTAAAAAAAAAPCGSAPGVAEGAAGAGEVQQQEGAEGEPEPVATKQFTASSKKQLTSKFRGVCWNKKNKRWQAAINSGGKYIYLGSFTSEGDAARQFDRAAIKIRGKKAKLNFPAKDYVDENGNLLDDFELPAPAGSGRPVTAGGGSSSKTAAQQPPGSSMLGQQQQQQQQQEMRPLAVDGSLMEPVRFGGQQAAAAAPAAGSWQHHLMMQQQQQQQQGQLWSEQQQQHIQRQLWQDHHHQQQNQAQLLKAHTWQEQHILAQQPQQAHAAHHAAAAAGGFSRQLLASSSLPPNTAANTVSGTSTGAGAPPSGEIANQAAIILAQRSSGQLAATDMQALGELHNAAGPAAAAAAQAGQPGLFAVPQGAPAGSMRQAGQTVTTSVGFASNSSSSFGRPGMVAPDMQQQQQLVPELTVAQLDLPPMMPLLPSGSMGAAATTTAMQQQQQQQQMLRMPSYGMPPHQAQHQQQSAPWQQQQVPASNGFSSMLNSYGSNAAQHYAQQPHAPLLQMSGSMGAAATCGPHQQQQQRQQQQQGSAVCHAPAITHALSARMTSCDLKEALHLARQAAAAQGVTDLPGALRQMSSAQLPVVTTTSGGSMHSQQQQQQQQHAIAGPALSSGMLQGHCSGGSSSHAASIASPAHLGQAASQAAASLAATEQAAAAAAAAVTVASGSPTRQGLTQADHEAASAALDAAAAPASKRARTSSLHD
uniref:AP2/ERF domain-containing protein n=1 Tax=Tetradesmus obliquus TaxID=3088 RepID=A0A383WJV0_TETOB